MGSFGCPNRQVLSRGSALLLGCCGLRMLFGFDMTEMLGFCHLKMQQTCGCLAAYPQTQIELVDFKIGDDSLLHLLQPEASTHQVM